MTPEAFWYLLVGLVVAALAGYLLVKRARVDSGGGRHEIRTVPPGWQFYSNPTTLEPPGTVFRIDSEGRRYIVDVLKMEIQSGSEAGGKTEESVEASTRIVARLLGLATTRAGLSARKTERLTFEITDPVAELIADAEFDLGITPFMEKLRIREGNRYFVIRNARKASAIHYRLSRTQVDDFGGEASITGKFRAEGKLLRSDRTGEYILEQVFKTPMRVMFLPEELRVATAGLAGDNPRIASYEVTEPLHWEDTSDTAL
jgi:hypothetical protein